MSATKQAGRRRTYKTSEPITEELVALHYLNPRISTYERCIFVMTDGDYPPTIHVEFWGGGFGQMEYTNTWYYEIAPELAQRMVGSGYLEKATNRVGMGWVYDQTYAVDRRMLFARTCRLTEEREEELRPLLIAGQHSKFSSLFVSSGVRFEHGEDRADQIGRPCFYFTTPAGDRVRIFSDTREIERLEAEVAK